jgi:hypothetical protein
MKLFFLQKNKINDGLNTLHFLVKRAGANMSLDKKYMEKKNETEEGLRKKTTMKAELNIGKAERDMKEQ